MGTRSGTGRLAAVAIIGVLGAALVATPASGATETGSATKACVVAGGAEAFVSSLWTAAAGPDADGAYPYQQWLVSDTGQAATQALVGVEDSVFGRLPSTASLETKLNRGLIGFAADYATQSLVAVARSTWTRWTPGST